MLIETLGVLQEPQDLVDLACFHLPNNPDLTHPEERVFLDIQPILTILKKLFFLQPSTSTQEVLHEETSQYVQDLLLTRRFPFCQEISNPILTKATPVETR